ncbi:MAG TPA: family 10 glycosylhydrolase [Microbacterium sp.]|nr:family 10 glycosylhydrolase [Microbacterium sp.]
MITHLDGSPRVARRATLLSLAVAAFLFGCSGERAVVSPPESKPEAGPSLALTVRASRGDASMMIRTPSAAPGERGGTTLQLDATVFNPQGKDLPNKKHVYWESADSSIATVDSTGLVTAQDTGLVAIYVDHKKGRDSVMIDIVAVPVASVTITGLDSMSVDDTASFVAAALDSAGVPLEGRAVTWASVAAGVAAVDSVGEVVALTPGATDISATIEGRTASQPLQVWPQPVVSVTISPATVSVPQFHKVKFTATARDRRGKALSGRAVTWSSSAPAIFYMKANGDTAAGKDLGEAVVTATVEGVSGTAEVTVTNPVEARALWVTRFEFTSGSAVDFAKIATIMEKAASANFNIVYFQARAAGDAFYFSDLEPCSPRMCTTLGGTRPAQDPLAVAIAEGNKHGIEVHAWLNAYTGFISGSAFICNSQFINSTPMNWLKANPDWSMSTKNFTTGDIARQVDNCVGTTEYMWVSPGVPAVRTHLARVAADIARRYGPLGLKGIHLDRIRFPGSTFSYDPATQEAFRQETGAYPTSNFQATWSNFRRELVNKGVREVRDSIRAVSPAMVLSAAVFPGYKREGAMATWSASWSHTDLFQDPQAWAQGGYLDVEAPMNYPATATSTSWTVKPTYCSSLDWTCVMDDHIERIERQSGRHVYVGVGAIKGWAEVQRQLELAHDRSATGVSVYSFSQVDGWNGWALLAAGPFKHKATIPAMAWK